MTKKDRLLIISGGTFGERFEKICEIHHIPFDALRLGQDEALTASRLDAYDAKDYTGLLVNLHETYTGQLYDIGMIHDFCSRNDLYLIVDAISTFLCDEYHMRRYGIDATIVSSQKGLCLADTGGHYSEGTTDITRTIALGGLTAEEKRAYTLALKGTCGWVR